MKAILFCTLVFTHRYIGIAIGWLMLLWCLSGLVMLYVSYPELSPRQRVAALAPLDTQCCELPDQLFDGGIGSVSVEMFNRQLHARIQPDVGPATFIDLNTGRPVAAIDASMALSVISAYRARRGLKGEPLLRGLIERDQWTVYPRYDNRRPLYRFALNDAAGTELYVSSVTGELAQVTQRTQRFWNWLGAVPHWLYFTELRQRPRLWSQVVIWSSSIGAFLALFGLYLGIWQLRRKSDNKLYSPYRGWKYWHHVPGLFFGVLVLTWVFSGLASMTPWRWLESAGVSAEAGLLHGSSPSWQSVRQSLLTLQDAELPNDTVRIASSILDGKLFYIAETRAGRQVRLDRQWRAAPLSPQERARIGELLGGLQVELMTREDAYYYTQVHAPVTLPVLRAIAGDTGERYYLDAQSGALLRKIDSGARWYRWLHTGLHRLDFHAALRVRPWRDLLMWFLLLGASAVCLTGVWLGIRRLRGV